MKKQDMHVDKVK